MSSPVEALVNREYKYGFVTDIEADTAPIGLSEDTVRLISAKKEEPEWLLEWRLKAYHHWLTMTEPKWARVHYPKIDFQDMYYYSAPKGSNRPKSLADVDPALLRSYVGRYVGPFDRPMKLEFADGELYSPAPYGRRRMLPMSDTTFLDEETGATLEVAHEAGRVERIAVLVDGVELMAFVPKEDDR